MKTIRVGILGLGVVGTGVADLLIRKKHLLESRIGARLSLKTIADIDTATDRGIDLKTAALVTDAGAVLTDPDIDVVVELIGGRSPAREFILTALQNGKHVVTANKALQADCGNE